MKKVENNQQRNNKYDEKLDKRKRKLRNPLYLDEKVLVLAERLKKKDAPSKFYKASTDNISFFNRDKFLLSIKEQNLTTDHICIGLKMKTTKKFNEDF